MKFVKTEIPEVVIIEPTVHGDDRGYFVETFRQDLFNKNVEEIRFVQDNESKSSYGVLRGLHYQLPPFSQSKLVRVISGKVLDVAVDIRKDSPTFGKYVAVELSSENKKQMFVPQGFAHGFVVLSDEVTFVYKVDNYYSKEHDRGLAFDDKDLNIDWRIPVSDMKLSEKDTKQPSFKEAELFE